jgi:peptidyl-prolyl cis-trans isomerase C
VVRTRTLPAHVAITMVLALVAGCLKQHASPPVATVVATVGGEPISQALFEAYAMEKAGVPFADINPALRATLLTQLKQVKAASLAAPKADTEVTQELELRRLEILSHRAASAAGMDQPPTDADLQQAYNDYVAQLPATEYHVSHILVASENAASVLVIKLQAGADFAQLARDQSADDSNVRGGDLGWISPGKLPREFTDAVQKLKVGEFTTKPVHTNYGWHLIQLQESRPMAVPTFDQVKPQLAANWQQSRYQAFLEQSLRDLPTSP